MRRLNTYTGLWSVITRWMDKLAAAGRRRDPLEARERELAAAKERANRENTGAAFDERMRRAP